VPSQELRSDQSSQIGVDHLRHVFTSVSVMRLSFRLPRSASHDARHHWAVRMARAGAPFELIARQLGHRDVAMVAKVYRRFKPDTEERDRWEQIATGREREKWPGRIATDVARAAAEPEEQDEESPATPLECEASGDSRGGTRTRDPGIMSAVL
jgi:hypothetical protein